MQTSYLIDAVVRQVTVLIAQLATAGGLRAPLAHIAEQVFVELSRELEQQGVSRKVSADMFGIALRTYQRRTQRLAESATERGRSLWEAVYQYLGESSVVTRGQTLLRFRYDDGNLVRGVLRDLTESGLAFASGTGAQTAYRVVSTEELGQLRQASTTNGLDALLWGVIYREGPSTKEQLALPGTTAATIDAAVHRLSTQGRIQVVVDAAGLTSYSAKELVIPADASAGFEGAVLDHFQALVRTICARLAGDAKGVEEGHVGGSTYHFAIWPGHPLEEEVLGSLQRFRGEQSDLRQRVDAHNEGVDRPPVRTKVVSYAGQCVIDEDHGANGKFGAADDATDKEES